MEALYRTLADSSIRTPGRGRRWNPVQGHLPLVPALRTALVKDLRLFDYLAGHAGALRRHQPSAIRHLARSCMQWREVEHRDPHPAACREFGCNTASRVEKVVPNISQNEAAVFGLLLDVTYSYLVGTLSVMEFERVVGVIASLGFSLFVADLHALTADAGRKQRVSGLPPFKMWVLKGIGRGTEIHLGELALFAHAIRLLEAWGGHGAMWPGTISADSYA